MLPSEFCCSVRPISLSSLHVCHQEQGSATPTRSEKECRYTDGLKRRAARWVLSERRRPLAPPSTRRRHRCRRQALQAQNGNSPIPRTRSTDREASAKTFWSTLVDTSVTAAPEGYVPSPPHVCSLNNRALSVFIVDERHNAR